VRAFRFLRSRLEHKTVTITLLGRVLKVEVLEELNLALDQDTDLIVITGRDGYFAAGADIAELNALSGPEAHAYARKGQRLFNKLAASNARTVAAIDGFCLGGGLDLALACQFRYATPRSVFAHPGGRIGILTGWGGTQRLPDRVGRARALEMMVAGRWVDAHTASEWGLVDEITESPLERALSLNE
jgi:enoyl-CoA hydratase